MRSGEEGLMPRSHRKELLWEGRAAFGVQKSEEADAENGATVETARLFTLC